MANQQSFRWRTIIEVGLISAIIYFFLGFPGLPRSTKNSASVLKDVRPSPGSTARVESLVTPRPGLQCSPHEYRIHVFSSTPLVIYIEDFLSPTEADHLVSISEDKWEQSTVFNHGVETTDTTIRKSEKALIERDDIVQCIEQRALEIQGWPKDVFIERVWTQRYNVSGHYAHHYDWATTTKSSRRVSTFMVYVSGQGLVGGGTNFPRLRQPRDERWCNFVECRHSSSAHPDEIATDLVGSNVDDGVTFRAKTRAAVFWENFDADGRGYKETIHAGMPVTEGVKIGLNIWSWYNAGE